MVEIIGIRKAGEIPEKKTKPSKVVPAGKLELTIKINELPQSRTIKNSWQQFEVDCDGQVFRVAVKPKVWKKLTIAHDNYPMWVAAINGKLGAKTPEGYILESAAIQVYEKKAKPPKEDNASQTEANSAKAAAS